MTDIYGHHVGTAVVAAPPFSRISWGSIIAGTICAFALQLLLNMIGLAAGFAAIDPAQDPNPLSGIAIGTGIWWGVSALISLFIGGWVAARLSGVPIRITAALHGVSVWALSVLLAVWLATSAITSVASGVVGAVSQVGQIAASAMGGSGGGSDDSTALGRMVNSVLSEQQDAISSAQTRLESISQDIRSEARQVYRQVVSPREQQQAVDAAQATARDIVRTPGDIGQDLNTLVDRLFSAEGVFSEEDKQQAMQVLQNRLGISEQEAEQIVDNWQQRYQAAVQEIEQATEELKQAATDAAQQATTVVSEASMWTAVALVLGLIAALLGGIIGRPAPWAVEAAEDVR